MGRDTRAMTEANAKAKRNRARANGAMKALAAVVVALAFARARAETARSDYAALAQTCEALGDETCMEALGNMEDPCATRAIAASCACDGDGCRIVSLSLAGRGLRGTLPTAALGDGFARLEVLDLSSNAIRGTIPESFIDALPRIRELYLNLNTLSGNIPRAIGKCRNLEVLNFDGGFTANQIWVEDYVPAARRAIYGEPGVHFGNQLTGRIPEEIGALVNLRYLNLHRNFLGAPGDAFALPRSIGALQKLEMMDVSGNQLTGRIPTELSTLSRLRQMNLDDNFITGSIPPDWSRAVALESFIVEGNRLSGVLPPTLPANVTFLDVHENYLTGSVNALKTLKRLEIALLDRNKFTGNVELSSADFPVLKTISLANNAGLCGNVPSFPFASDEAKAAECDKPLEPCQLWPVIAGTKLGKDCECVGVGQACSVLSLENRGGERCCSQGTCAEVPYSFGLKYCLPCSEENQKCGGVNFDGARCCARDLTCSRVDDNTSVCRPCASLWDQCGGSYFLGAKCCVTGSACVYFTEYYSQCQPNKG